MEILFNLVLLGQLGCDPWVPKFTPYDLQGDDNRIVPAHDFIASDNPVAVSADDGNFCGAFLVI